MQIFPWFMQVTLIYHAHQVTQQRFTKPAWLEINLLSLRTQLNIKLYQTN